MIIKVICYYLDDNDFLDIEIFYLGKFILEGVRDYLVFLCVYVGYFYVLL